VSTEDQWPAKGADMSTSRKLAVVALALSASLLGYAQIAESG
jgi:hypothetical protein